jgi:hypothetical protein
MSKANIAMIAGKTSYEGSVIIRAMGRAGHNPHIKGHIHEILVKDAHNLKNVFNGASTNLTKSTTAQCVDLVTTKAGKVIGRMQIKDTLSQSSVDKIIKQVADGKYRSVKLVGTEETVERVNAALEKAGLSKRMVSSGTSSKTTTTLAQRAGATGSGTLGGAVLSAAKSGGVAGAAIGGGIAIIKGASGLMDGTKSVGEVAMDVGGATIKGGITGAGASAAAVGTGAATTAGLALLGIEAGMVATAATFALPVAAAVLVGWGITSVWDDIFD